MDSSTSQCTALAGVWLPLSNALQDRIRAATEGAFLGRAWLKAPSGERIVQRDVLRHNAKAEGPLASALKKLALAEHGDVAWLIEEHYPPLVPHFVLCGTQNPVHHTAYVLDLLTTTLIGEHCTPEEIKVGLLAALFHDSGQGLARGKKTTELHLEQRIQEVVAEDQAPEELRECRDKAIQNRKEHMEAGAAIARDMLPQHVPSAVLDRIVRIVEHHDDPKIPLVHRKIREVLAGREGARGGGKGEWAAAVTEWKTRHAGPVLDALLRETGVKYLFPCGDLVLQCHHEADLLWMVTQDGIEADLVRFSPLERKTPAEMLENNVQLHRDEYALHADLLSTAEVSRYGFRDRTAYRSGTGYQLFTHLTRHLNTRYAALRVPMRGLYSPRRR